MGKKTKKKDEGLSEKHFKLLDSPEFRNAVRDVLFLEGLIINPPKEEASGSQTTDQD